MRFHSSYIFLPNPYCEKPAQYEDEKGVIYVNLDRSLSSYLKKVFPDIKVKRNDDLFFEYTYSLIVGNLIEVTIITKNVGDSYYANVIAEGKTKATTIEALDYVHTVLYDNDIKKEYISIPSYDAVSEHYCNKLYPKLNKLERNLRKLMFNIYVLEFGKDYFKTTTTKEIQNEAKKKIKAKGNDNNKEIQRIPLYLYSLEYSDIQKLLFDPRWTKVDNDNKNAFLDNHEDLSKLSDEELRAVINDISPKSDWERFFAEKFQGVDVEKDIETVRSIRNIVAHCKLLKKTEYETCNEIINKLNRALVNAITITEEKDFANKNAENLQRALSGFSSRIHEMMERLRETFLTLSKSTSTMFDVSATPEFEKIKNFLDAPSQLSGIFKSIEPDLIFPKDYFSDYIKSFDIAKSIAKPFQNMRDCLYNDMTDTLKLSILENFPNEVGDGQVLDGTEKTEDREDYKKP